MLISTSTTTTLVLVFLKKTQQYLFFFNTIYYDLINRITMDEIIRYLQSIGISKKDI